MILPSCQVHDAGELTWAPAASVLVVPHVLVNPQHPNPCKAGGVIRCGLQTRLDMGPHGIPRSCQLSSQSCNGGSLEAQLSDRPADRPHTQTRPGCTHPLIMFQECHRLAGGFAAYPSALKPSDPHRDPGPGRVDHLHHHTPVALSDHPTTRAASTAIAGLYVEYQSTLTPSGSNQMETLQVDEQITSITTIKRHRAAAGRVRHRPRSLTTAGVEVRSSPGTSTSTRNPRPTPGHPHSTRKSPSTTRSARSPRTGAVHRLLLRLPRGLLRLVRRADRPRGGRPERRPPFPRRPRARRETEGGGHPKHRRPPPGRGLQARARAPRELDEAGVHGVRRALHHRRLRRGPGRARAPLPVVLRRGAPGHRVLRRGSGPGDAGGGRPGHSGGRTC